MTSFFLQETRAAILSAIQQLRVHAVELDDDEARSLNIRAETSFAKPGNEPLWERFLDDESIQDAHAWRAIEGFVLGPTTLLVRDTHRVLAVRFASSADLVATLDDCPGFEFYVLDDKISFIIAFNDHDMLIGCGAAIQWVRQLRSNQ